MWQALRSKERQHPYHSPLTNNFKCNNPNEDTVAQTAVAGSQHNGCLFEDFVIPGLWHDGPLLPRRVCGQPHLFARGAAPVLLPLHLLDGGHHTLVVPAGHNPLAPVAHSLRGDRGSDRGGSDRVLTHVCVQQNVWVCRRKATSWGTLMVAQVKFEKAVFLEERPLTKTILLQAALGALENHEAKTPNSNIAK